MKRLLVFIIALICLSFYTGIVNAELLKNPGFEDGDNPGYHGQNWSEAVNPEYWWKYGSVGWDSWKSVWGGSVWAVPHTGDKLVGIGAWDFGSSYYHTGQTVLVNPGETFTFTVWARTELWTPDGSTPVGGLMIEWKDSAENTISTEGPLNIINGSESSDWTQYSLGPVVAPLLSVKANVQIYGEARGSVLFDDCSFFLTYAANDPIPDINVVVSPSTTTQLSWARPAPRTTGPVTVDVWFGPSIGEMTKVVNNQAVDSWTITPPLSAPTYYWRVDCRDDSILTFGRQWQFFTNTAPVVDAGKKQAVWLSSGTATVTLAGTATDDNLPNPPAAVTYLWTKESGPGSVVFSPSNTVKDPNATFTTAGDYILKLTANDSQFDSNDTVKIRVYSQTYTGLAAQWKLDETTGTTATDNISAHNGTLVGGPVWQPAGGYVDGAILLDGVDDYINCGGGVVDHNSPSWADFIDEITVSAWIKVDAFDSNTWQAIVTKGDTSWRLARAGNENVINFACNGLSPSFDVQGFTDVADGQWHHIVGTYDGTEIALYVDGILDIWSGSPSSASGSIAFDNNDVYIGANSGMANREFPGMIDQVRIYEIGLPADRVVNLFREDGGKNSCSQNLSGDINGDCYVDFTDFAEMALNWLKCNDVGNSQCD